jgi:hypothetical protein
MPARLAPLPLLRLPVSGDGTEEADSGSAADRSVGEVAENMEPGPNTDCGCEEVAAGACRCS